MEEESARRIHDVLAGILFGVCLGVYTTALNDLIRASPNEIEIRLILFGASYVIMLKFWYTYVFYFGKYSPSREWKNWVLDFTLPFVGFQGVLLLPSDVTQWYFWFGMVYLVATFKWSLLLREKGSEKMPSPIMTRVRSEIVEEVFTVVMFIGSFIILSFQSSYLLRLVLAILAATRSFVMLLRPYMQRATHLLFVTYKKDSKIGYLLTFFISWIALAILFTLNAQATGAGPTLPYMKEWPIWLVYIVDIVFVCWPIPLILDIPLFFGFWSSWFLFLLVAVPSDLLRSCLQPYVGAWIVTPWPDIAIECLLVIFVCFIFLPIQSHFNRFIEKILEKVHT